jgi:uncharacterized protein (DUF433 family)
MVYSDLMEATLEHDVRPAVRRLSACVEKNAARLGGEPVFRGTRVPVKSLFDHLSAGDSVETFLDDFPGITRKQVQTALEAAGVYLDSVPNGRGQA